MFIGEYHHNLDEKGRLAIPLKFREALAKGAVITRGLDNCLFLFTASEWQKLADKISALPISGANTRAFARLMLAGAMEVDIDKQGRIILPEYLRRFSAMSKEIIIAGLYNRIELWDASNWQQYKLQTEQDSTAIAERMGELGI